jgi:hypothetical protein
LIKGLLTKDDEKRWGKEQVDRWMSGERDIPVFYETSSASETRGVKPFRFCGSDFYTKESLARAFAAHEEPWNTPSDHLRFIRLWLESNLEFDEARHIGGAIAGNDPEIALFRFIHSNAEIPFGVYGHIVNLDAICVFLRRAVSKEASEAERRIARMLEDGRMALFYREYAMFGEIDESFNELLGILNGEPPVRQLDYAEAMRDPGTRLWPGDADTKTASERLECMRKILSAPLKLEAVNEIKNLYVIPDALWAMLERSDTYASGADRLNRWRETKLLVPKGSGDEAYRKLSVKGYERAAKVHMWGHTASTLRRLNGFREAISGLYSERPTPVFPDTAKELEFLRDRKISARDLVFWNTVSNLLSKRRELRRNRRKDLMIYGVAGIGILAAIRVVFSFILGFSHIQLTIFGFLLLFLFGFFLLGTLCFGGDIIKYIGKRTERYGEMDEGVAFIAIMLIFVMRGLPALATSEQVVRIIELYFPLLGGPMGVLVSNTLFGIRMGRNMDEIVGACRAYTYYHDTGGARDF